MIHLPALTPRLQPLWLMTRDQLTSILETNLRYPVHFHRAKTFLHLQRAIFLPWPQEGVLTCLRLTRVVPGIRCWRWL